MTKPIQSYFNNTTTTLVTEQPKEQQPPSWGASLYNGGSWLLGGVKSLSFFIPRWTAEEAVQGAANRSGAIFAEHKDEFTQRARDVVVDALLQALPKNYQDLQTHIQAFLTQPSLEDLDTIKQLIEGLQAEDILKYSKGRISKEGIDAVLSLKSTLDKMVTLSKKDEQLELVIQPEAVQHLQVTAEILKGISEIYEGPVSLIKSRVIPECVDEIKMQVNKAFQGIFSSQTPLSPSLPTTVVLPVTATALSSLTTTATIQPVTTASSTSTTLMPVSSSSQTSTTTSTTTIQPVTTASSTSTTTTTSTTYVQPITTTTSTTTTSPQTTSSPAAISIGNILNSGQGLFSSILSSTGDGAARFAANQLARLMRYVLESIRDHIIEKKEYPHLLQTINPLIQRLQNPEALNSLGAVTDIVGDAFGFMQSQQIYFQSLRLPLSSVRNHASAIPGFLNNINSHQNILQPFANRHASQVTPEMLNAQMERLKMRSTSYGPAQFVVEKFCGLSVSSSFYSEIYRSTSDPLDGDLTSAFRKRLFDKIDGENMNFIMKWLAKRLYDILHPLSRFYVHSMMDNMNKKVMDWMKPNSSSRATKDEVLIDLARNWLAELSGAFNNVAFSPSSQSRDIKVLMEEALKMPERNGGLSQQELYAAVAKTALDTFGPNITWSETIDEHFNVEIPSDSSFSFLNPVIKVLSTVCNYTLQAIVFVPQWVGNQVLKLGTKIAVSYTPTLKDFAEKTIDSLRRNTPSSYKMQCLIFRQMQKVLQILQEDLNNEETLSGEVKSRNTNIKTVQIEGLVHYIHEVLNKCQYGTKDSLRRFLEKQGPLRNRGEHELEDTFLPELMPSIVQTISIAFETLTKEEEMHEMLYNGLQIANSVFDEEQPVSDEDFAAIERGIRDLSDQILEMAIFHAIGENVDFTKDKEKRTISQFVTTLKNQSHQFAEQLTNQANEIATDRHLSGEALRSKVFALIDTSSKYNSDRVDALSKADGNRNLNSETKYKLNDSSRELSTQCQTLTELLNRMKTAFDESVNADELLYQVLYSCFNAQNALTDKLQNLPLSSDDILFCKTQLSLFKNSLTPLRHHPCSNQLREQIQSKVEELNKTFDVIDNLHLSNEILRRAELQYNLLRQEKIRSIGFPPSPTLKSREKDLFNLLHTLPNAQQKNRLIRELNLFMQSTTSMQVATIADRFSNSTNELSTKNAQEMNAQLELFRRTGEMFHQQLQSAIESATASYADNKDSVRKLAKEAAIQAENIDRWAQTQQNIPIWTINRFDMQWVIDGIKDIAFHRARTKMQQFFDALYQRHNYIGAVNQMLLLPFLKNFGDHHLKTGSGLNS